MTDVWSQRADAYRTSSIHAAGEDLDLVVEWCAPAGRSRTRAGLIDPHRHTIP